MHLRLPHAFDGDTPQTPIIGLETKIVSGKVLLRHAHHRTEVSRESGDGLDGHPQTASLVGGNGHLGCSRSAKAINRKVQEAWVGGVGADKRVSGTYPRLRRRRANEKLP